MKTLILCDPSILLVVLLAHPRNTCYPGRRFDAAMAVVPRALIEMPHSQQHDTSSRCPTSALIMSNAPSPSTELPNLHDGGDDLGFKLPMYHQDRLNAGPGFAENTGRESNHTRVEETWSNKQRSTMVKGPAIQQSHQQLCQQLHRTHSEQRLKNN